MAISTLTIVEMIYLVERNRIAREAFDRLMEELDLRRSGLIAFSLDQHIAQAVARIDRAVVPDMPDRVIAATALAIGVPLLTRDARIRASGVPTIW
jgi:predicted nucleic acid-binding protein